MAALPLLPSAATSHVSSRMYTSSLRACFVVGAAWLKVTQRTALTRPSLVLSATRSFHPSRSFLASLTLESRSSTGAHRTMALPNVLIPLVLSAVVAAFSHNVRVPPTSRSRYCNFTTLITIQDHHYPLVNRAHHPSKHVVDVAMDALARRALPGAWVPLACYNDAVGLRTLTAATLATQASTQRRSFPSFLTQIPGHDA